MFFGTGYNDFNPFYEPKIIPTWTFSINLRFNKLFNLGFGINFLYLDFFCKFTFPSFYFDDNFLAEFFVKTRIIGGFIPLNFEIGGEFYIGYLLRFNDRYGIFIDFGGFIMYYPSKSLTFYTITTRFGISFNF